MKGADLPWGRGAALFGCERFFFCLLLLRLRLNAGGDINYFLAAVKAAIAADAVPEMRLLAVLAHRKARCHKGVM